jgi:hypothetical protein
MRMNRPSGVRLDRGGCNRYITRPISHKTGEVAMAGRKPCAVWGLALVVLLGGALAHAQPPAPSPSSALDLVPSPPAVAPAPAKPDTTAWPVAELFKIEPAKEPGHSEAPAHHEERHDEPAEDHNALFFNAECLLWRPMRQNTDYAITGTNPNWGPLGVIHNVDGGFDSGFRAGAGYHWCGGQEVLLQYTFFWANADDRVQAPAGGRVFPTLTHPAVVTGVDAAQAKNSIGVNLIDLELGQRWKCSEAMTARLFAGPRLASLQQTMTATYTGGDVDSDMVRRRMTFDGAGLRAGGEANWKFWEFLGVYVRGSASILVGRTRSSLAETANGQPIVGVSERYDKLVPIVDLGTGLSFQRHGLRITAGYEFINWFGVNDAIDFSDDNSPGKLGRRTGDLGFGGLVFRAEWLF